MPADLTLATAVRAIAARAPDRPALVDAISSAATSYRALADRAARLAGGLAKIHGVARGDRLAVLALNDVRTFELLLACSHLGAILVPLNHRLSDAELVAILARCTPRLLFTDAAHAARRPHAYDQRDLDALPYDGPAHDALGALEEPRVMLFTSGTTGRPKGALLPERMIAANAASTARAWSLTAADVALIDAPLFHTGGLNVLATPLLHLGGTAVVAPRFDADRSGRYLIEHGCTVAFGVPTMLERFLAAGVVDAARVRLWVTGGAPCPRSLLDAFAARDARLVQGFGMTECGPNCFAPEPHTPPGSIGVPAAGLEARVADDGELWLRGPHVFAGYHDDAEATRAAIDADGWLHTGDVLRATAAGWWVAGRKKEMFISGGENVYPAEVEAALMMHPSVAEAAVIAVPDARWGEAGEAYVLLRETDGDGATPEALRAFLRERLAGYKIPRAIRLVRELPRTASNKIDKRALQSGPGPDEHDSTHS